MERPVPLADTVHAGHCHHHHDPTPTGQLRDEHQVILRALALLERMGRALDAGKAVDRGHLAWLRGFFETFADRCHHGKEEQHLFPALERHGIPREGGPLGVMLREHEEGRELLRAMARDDDRGVVGAIREYVTLLRTHIDKENGVLFPLAEQVLPEGEQRQLVEAFEAVERTMGGGGFHERFLAELTRLEATAP